MRKFVSLCSGIARIMRSVKRPSVKSIKARIAPAEKASQISFWHSLTKSISNFSREYPEVSLSNGYKRDNIDGEITACFIDFVVNKRAILVDFDAKKSIRKGLSGKKWKLPMMSISKKHKMLTARN